MVDGVLLAGGALPVLGLPGSRLLELAGRAGLPVVAEAFADRAYTDEGTLVPRGQDGAVVADPDAVLERSVALAVSGAVVARSGRGSRSARVPCACTVTRPARWNWRGASGAAGGVRCAGGAFA